MSDSELGFDRVPTRYELDNGKEVIDLIREFLTPEEFLGFCKGNVMKYQARAGKKGPADIDMQKAAFYYKMELYAKGIGEDPRSHRATSAPDGAVVRE
jgi:hypothetical protein